jgi:hypothetical protein
MSGAGALVLMIVVPGAVVTAGQRKRWKRRPVPDEAERRVRRATQRLAVVADEPCRAPG